MNLLALSQQLQQHFSWQNVEIKPLGELNSYFNQTFKILADGQVYALQCVPTQSAVFAKNAHQQLPQVLAALNIPQRKQWYPHRYLEMIATKNGDYYLPSQINGQEVALRLFKWIDSTAIAQVTETIAFEAGKILADFHLAVQDVKGLNDLVEHAIEPLPHFHDTAWYLQHWQQALTKNQWADSTLNLKEHLTTIEQGVELIKQFDVFRQQQLQQQPRIMHGDPKLANMLFEHEQAIALIDFDTIMTGLWLYDVADALRSLCNTQPENGDINQVTFDLNLFSAFMRGYAPALLAWTDQEKQMLSSAISLLPLELGIRFLFGCHQNHPLRLEAQPQAAAHKALVQLRLFKDIQHKQPQIDHILQQKMPKTLITHPQQVQQPPVTIQTVIRQNAQQLEVFYRVASQQSLDDCLAAVPVVKIAENQAKGLWQHNCLEVFIANKNQSAYLEFNGSSTQQSDLFYFNHERVNGQGIKTSEHILPTCATQAQWQWFYMQTSNHQALAKFSLDLISVAEVIDTTQPIEYSVTAVVEDRQGQHYYLALQHCRSEADFHARESFCCV
ncbi:phosphotransferase [uncultured Agitococcus sp.]|uniref:phosphotransferase n=1 Tax=uncultured Agitococcus sp. TaxID=1506599 RepID=UPI002621EE81|nr:phosphotransferase [uncultured Agitococcus sp.]